MTLGMETKGLPNPQVGLVRRRRTQRFKILWHSKPRPKLRHKEKDPPVELNKIHKLGLGKRCLSFGWLSISSSLLYRGPTSKETLVQLPQLFTGLRWTWRCLNSVSHEGPTVVHWWYFLFPRSLNKSRRRTLFCSGPSTGGYIPFLLYFFLLLPHE